MVPLVRSILIAGAALVALSGCSVESEEEAVDSKAAVTNAKKQCVCSPIPTSKTYQGDARKEHLIGYSIDWNCTYKCTTDSESSPREPVKASYHGYYVGAENGREGICEGMVYKPQYTPMVNSEVYLYTGEDYDFNPSDSDSEDLRKWAADNNCE